MKARTAADARRLIDLPNIGKAMLEDFRVLDIQTPQQLIDRDPYQLYEELCLRTGQRHDPCVIDTLISAVQFMQGAAPLPWWHYTAERKQKLGG